MALVSRDTRHRKVQRSDAALVLDTTPVEGHVTTVKTPKNVSLVALPANQTPIQIIRSDDTTDQGETVNHSKIVKRRVRRSQEVNPVLRMAFPTNYDEDAVKDALVKFGMDGYTVENFEGTFLATRADVQSIASKDTVSIKLTEDGITATVARADALISKPSGLRLAALEFDVTRFDAESAAAWMAEKQVDIANPQTENSDDSCVVKRSDMTADAEVRRMELDTGVVAVVVQAERNDLPAQYADIITDTAYGNWGWGHLDFASALADTAFCDAASAGIYRLENVLREIMFYSDLPLDVRKTLVANATGQFNEFINSLMDSLPRTVVVAVARSDKQPNVESSMSKKPEDQTTDATAVTQTEATIAAAAHAAPAAAPENDTVTISRSQLSEMISSGIAAAFAARKDNTIPDAAAVAAATEGQPAATAATATPATAPATTEAAITRADLAAVLTEAIKPIQDRLDRFESTTIVRSDASDATNQPTDSTVKRSDSVWSGSLIRTK